MDGAILRDEFINDWQLSINIKRKIKTNKLIIQKKINEFDICKSIKWLYQKKKTTI